MARLVRGRMGPDARTRAGCATAMERGSEALEEAILNRHALIVALEHYPEFRAHRTGISGAFEGAQEVRRALEELGIGRENAIIHASIDGPQPADTEPATRAALLRSLKRMQLEWRDKTKQIFVFLAGLGLAFERDRHARPVDLLATADFVSPEEPSGTLKLDQLLLFLLGLGSGRDAELFVFIETERLAERLSSLAGGDLGLNLSPPRSGRPSVSLLALARDSSRPGPLVLGSRLATALRGKGFGRRWLDGSRAVTFDGFAEDLSAELGESLEIQSQREGSEHGLLRPLADELARVELDVRGEGLTPGRSEPCLLLRKTNTEEVQRRPLRLGATTLEVESGYYALTLEADGLEGRFNPPSPLWLDGRTQLTLDLSASDEPIQTPQRAYLELQAPLGTQVQMSSWPDGAALASADLQATNVLWPGTYRLQLLGGGRTITEQRVQLSSGERRRIELAPPKLPTNLEPLLEESGAHPLVALHDREPSTLLALVAASRILGRIRGESTRLASLEDFAHIGPREAGLYVLGLAGDSRPKEVSLQSTSGVEVAHTPVSEILGYPGLWQAAARRVRRHARVLINRGDRAALSLVPPFLPGRVTILAIGELEPAQLDLVVLLVPAAKVAPELLAAEHPMIARAEDPLRGVLALARAQHDFAAGRLDQLDSLEAAESDSVVGPLLVHAALRRGDSTRARQLTENLSRTQPALGDTSALARLFGLPGPRTPSVRRVLWLDSALSVIPGGDASRMRPPWPNAHLLLDGPWAAWIDVIAPLARREANRVIL